VRQGSSFGDAKLDDAGRRTLQAASRRKLALSRVDRGAGDSLAVDQALENF